MRTKLAIALLSAALPLLASAAQIPNYTADYTLMVHGMHVGSTETTFQSADNQYQIASVTHTKFMFFKDTITESSKGAVSQGQFIPLSYHIEDTKKNQPVDISFDQSAHTAKITYAGKSLTTKTVANVQDNKSYLLNLRAALMAGKTELSLPVLVQDKNHHSQIETFHFTQLGTPTLETALGKLKTVEMTRFDKNTDTTDNFWFAPSKQYLMVQTEALKEGKVFAEVKISKLS